MSRVAVVPEEPDAPQDMTSEEILRFCRRISTRWDDGQAREQLSRFGVPSKTPFGKLSKGAAQAGVARDCAGHLA